MTRTTDAPAASRAMTIRLDGPLADRLNLAALATDQALIEIIRAALRQHLQAVEADPANAARYDELRAALNPKD